MTCAARLPPGTDLRSPVRVTDGTARINLTGEINDVTGAAQEEAFAQVVFTALEFPEVKRVRFQIDGKEVDTPTDQGNQKRGQRIGLRIAAASPLTNPVGPDRSRRWARRWLRRRPGLGLEHRCRPEQFRRHRLEGTDRFGHWYPDHLG